MTRTGPPLPSSPMPDPANTDPMGVLRDRFRAAIAAAFPEAGPDADPLISPSKQPQAGDFQCNAAMSLAKRVGRPPRDVAAAIVAKLDVGEIAEPVTESSIAGPGFINIRLRGDALASLLAGLDTRHLGLKPARDRQTVLVDLCGVNIAKEMHVGHLRATVIGDTLARVFERLGHTVIRQNHVGDWGLPIAMVTAKLQREATAGRVDLARVTLEQLTVLYRAAQAECAADRRGLDAVRRFGLGPKAAAELEEQVAGADEAMARAKQTLLKLQAHDPPTVAVWKTIYDVTMNECLAVCRRLSTRITAADSAGESSYAEELAPLVDDLVRRGIAHESDGALVVRLDDLGIDVPCIVRKSDGGFVYATTDIAAVRRRVQKLGADRVVYAVGSPQMLHLKQIFAAATKAGYATRPGATSPARLEHAAFGSVLGEDGRMFKTRSGDNVRLTDLLEEAIQRAERAVEQNAAAREGPAAKQELSPPERRAVAEAVGIAAIKYADLCGDRIKDYVFSFDRMLAFEGNTGPYLLYAVARVRSIFRKAVGAGVTFDPSAPLAIAEPAEKQLALALLRYPAAVRSVAESLEPHRVCQFAYDLAVAFSAFYDACPVLKAEGAVRASRLRLCDLTARALEDALGVLGIPTLQRM